MVIKMEKAIEYLKKELSSLRQELYELDDKLHINELDIVHSRQAVENIDKNSDSTGNIFMSSGNCNEFENQEIHRLNEMIDGLVDSQHQMSTKRDQLAKKIKKIEEILSETNKQDKEYRYTSYDLINYVEAERQRISGDIHDSIVQNMTALMYKLELIKKVMDTDHNRAKLEIESGSKIVKDCIEELRNIIFNLHPMSLEDLDTEGVFNDFIEKIKKSTDMIVNYTYNSDVSHIDNSIVIMLLRIIQELCNNSIKHSGGTTISIDVNISNGIITIIQSDDGKGYDCSIADKPKTTTDNTGYGLVLLKERIGLINGKITIKSLEAGGIEYHISVPIP